MEITGKLQKVIYTATTFITNQMKFIYKNSEEMGS